MARKQIKIGHTRSWRHSQTTGLREEVDVFQVISVKNSTAYMPSQRLTRADVDALCDSSSTWEVTLVPLTEGGSRG